MNLSFLRFFNHKPVVSILMAITGKRPVHDSLASNPAAINKVMKTTGQNRQFAHLVFSLKRKTTVLIIPTVFIPTAVQAPSSTK